MLLQMTSARLLLKLMALITNFPFSPVSSFHYRGHRDEALEASAGNYLRVRTVIRRDTIREAIFIRHICSHFAPFV